MASEEQLRERLDSRNPFTRWRAERSLNQLGIYFVDPAIVIGPGSEAFPCPAEYRLRDSTPEETTPDAQ